MREESGILRTKGATTREKFCVDYESRLSIEPIFSSPAHSDIHKFVDEIFLEVQSGLTVFLSISYESKSPALPEMEFRGSSH